jgi:hypothetical protein
MATDDSFEKYSVAFPTDLPLQSSVPYNSMLMFFSPFASIANSLPFSCSTVMHEEGPRPDSTCVVLLASLQVNSHAPAEGRRVMAESDSGRSVDHLILPVSKFLEVKLGTLEGKKSSRVGLEASIPWL